MMRRALPIMLTASSLLWLGCKDKPAAEGKPVDRSGNRVASCNLIKSESICRQYSDANISAAGEDFIKGSCSGGDFRMEACPADKRIGSCVTQEGTKIFYNDGPLALATDEAGRRCKEGEPPGEWMEGQ